MTELGGSGVDDFRDNGGLTGIITGAAGAG